MPAMPVMPAQPAPLPAQPVPVAPAPAPAPPAPAPAQPAAPSPITYEPPQNARTLDETDYANIIRVVGIIVVTAIVLWLAYALMITVRPR
jgi:hypothetical protein